MKWVGLYLLLAGALVYLCVMYEREIMRLKRQVAHLDHALRRHLLTHSSTMRVADASGFYPGVKVRIVGAEGQSPAQGEAPEDGIGSAPPPGPTLFDVGDERWEWWSGGSPDPELLTRGSATVEGSSLHPPVVPPDQ